MSASNLPGHDGRCAVRLCGEATVTFRVTDAEAGCTVGYCRKHADAAILLFGPAKVPAARSGS